MQNLLDLMLEPITRQVIAPHGRLLGEPTAAVTAGAGAVIQTVLSGIATKSTEPDGMFQILSMMSDARLHALAHEDSGGVLAGMHPPNRVMSLGQVFLRGLFGQRVGGLVDAVASVSGLSAIASTNLLAVAAPMMLISIKNFRDTNQLDDAVFARLLGSQGEFLLRVMDPRVAAAAGLSPTTFADDDAQSDSEPPAIASRNQLGTKPLARLVRGVRWVPSWAMWLLVVGVVIVMLPQLRGGYATTKPSAATVQPLESDAATVPDGMPRDFIATVKRCFERPITTAKPPTFDAVRFEPGSATVTAESMRQIAQLASALNEHPRTAVTVEGHVDNTGYALSDEILSADRARAVKVLLERMGVAAERIVSKGYGAAMAAARKSADANRAPNERIDLRVVQR